jgi:hypothetical protein
LDVLIQALLVRGFRSNSNADEMSRGGDQAHPWVYRLSSADDRARTAGFGRQASDFYGRRIRPGADFTRALRVALMMMYAGAGSSHTTTVET